MSIDRTAARWGPFPVPGIRLRSLAAAIVLTTMVSACGDSDEGDGSGDGSNGDEAASESQAPEMPEVEGPITEPGDVRIDPFEPGMEVTREDLGYVSEEFFVAGTAAGEPYKVRVLVTRPGDDAEVDFSGHAIVEAMHATGIPFVWNFTREYLMASGHAAVEISIFPNTVTNHLQGEEGAEHERYGELHIAEDAADNAEEGEEAAGAADIYAQVGLLLKSDESPLPGAQWLHMTGHSMAVGPVWHYMDTHHNTYRMPDGGPIYDGFFPETTRTGSGKGPFPEVDVPTILINSELEVEAVIVEDGTDYRRPDSDEPGEQFRLYEVAGLPHNPSWMDPVLQAAGLPDQAKELCVNPQLNDFPYKPTISMALNHLIGWVGEDVSPPRAERIALTGPIGEPGTEVERDEHGNAMGGVRSTTLDAPIATYLGSNAYTEAALSDDETLLAGDCTVYGSRLDFPVDELTDLYGDPGGYVDQVENQLDELIADGWYLEMFAEDLLTEAAELEF